MTPISGPDFICIGMPKAGTGWLFDQLQYHPDFWMPPTKELHYLDRENPPLRNAVRQLERIDRSLRGSGIKPRHRRVGDERDSTFLREASALSGQPRDLARYSALYRHKGQHLSGDISPGYSRLEDNIVRDVGIHLPLTKILFLIRDPVSRAWSRISMAHRGGTFDQALLADPTGFRAYLQGSEKINGRSIPTEIAARWKRQAPEINFRYILFDDIAARPEETRRDILVFLGADPDKKSGDLSPDYNRKQNNAKLEMTAIARAELVAYFADELRACGTVFGGAASQWAEHYEL